MAKKRGKKKDIRTGFEELLEIDPANCSVNVCLASVGADTLIPDYRILRIADGVAAEFREVCESLLKSQRRNVENGNFGIESYNAVAKLDSHQVEHLDLNQHANIKKQLKGIAALKDVPAFRDTKGATDDLRFYVICLGPDDGVPVYFIRSTSPKMELGRSLKLALMFSGGQFDKMHESVLLFDRGVDCICRGDDLYVFNKGRFEAIFQFFEMVKKAATETLETIRTSVPIHNFEELEAACLSHIHMLKKLKNIASQPYLKEIKITHVRKVIEEMELPLKVEKHDRKLKLVFDPKDKWAILRLLDDDYLRSIMTGEDYEVNSKRNM